ncbi:MAG: hypothetical protein KC496_16450 [Anaerolineae bacterium]|nr:hypothetical protein [Anaerolineae bacterium]
MASWNELIERFKNLQTKNRSKVALLLNPKFEHLPLPITRHDDPFYPFSREVVDATRDLVCAYVFDLASYMAMGAAGVVALERSIRYAGIDTPVILHGAFSGRGYSPMADATGFGVDAITVGLIQDVSFYLENPPYGAFFADYAGLETEVPVAGGIYRIRRGLIELRDPSGEILHLQVTRDDLLTVGKLDDYAEKIREAVENYL